MSRLRAVDPQEPPPVELSFADACRSMLEKMLASGCRTMMIIAGTSDSTEWCSIPSAPALERGLVLDVAEEIIPGLLRSGDE